MIPPFRSPAGASALARLLSRPTLLAFDYDGTLSPLCAEADSARVDAAWSARLRRIAHRWPVAVISGRTLADVTSRLGFQAAYIAGNHGAESPGTRLPPHISGRLDLARIALARDHDTLARAGVVIEDKGMSLAVHYRNAICPGDALARIGRLLSGLRDAISVSHGKAVFNVSVAAAPDKGVALRCAMRACRVRQAIYVGDDVNDKSAFIAAMENPKSVTVRVGSRLAHTRARFSIGTQTRVGALLHTLDAWPR